MAKRPSHSAPAKKKRTVRIALWIVLALLFVGALIAVLSLIARTPMPIDETENNTGSSAAVSDASAAVETPLPEELQEEPLSPDAEIAARTAGHADGFPMFSRDLSLFSLDSRSRMRYSGESYLTGIDVSEHQGDVDWEKVAADGIDFVMIRIGYRGSTAGSIYDDEYFKENISGALAAGLKVGVYFYSQAVNTAEAAEEADYVLQAIKPYDVTFPVVFDWEIVGGSEARTYTVSRAVITDCAKTFCRAVEDAGYDAMIYFTQYLGYRKYILRQLTDYEFWYAEYEEKPRIIFDFDMWQYSSTGSVDGIAGDVDLNIYFRQ
jgi:lysozyme